MMTREEAIERIKNDIEFNHNCLADEYITALEMAIKALEQEPKRGEWVKTYPHMLSVEEQRFYGAKDPKEPMPDKRFSVTVCSLCGETRPCGEDNYCPNCGARMESDEE